MKKRLYIFKNGFRSVMEGQGNTMFTPSIDVEVEEEVELDEATDQEIKSLKRNMHDINIINRVKKRKADRLKNNG